MVRLAIFVHFVHENCGHTDTQTHRHRQTLCQILHKLILRKTKKRLLQSSYVYGEEIHTKSRNFLRTHTQFQSPHRSYVKLLFVVGTTPPGRTSR